MTTREFFAIGLVVLASLAQQLTTLAATVTLDFDTPEYPNGSSPPHAR
jgi:hypothetical protein